MSLKAIKSLAPRIGVRIALWYSTLLILTLLVVFLAACYFLATALKNRDLLEIESEISEIGTEYAAGGIDGVRYFVEHHLSTRLKRQLIIRFADSTNTTLFYAMPEDNHGIDIGRIEKLPPKGGKHFQIRNGKSPHEFFFVTRSMGSDVVLQLGMSSRSRDMILSEFNRFWVLGVVPLMIIGIAGGMFLSFRILKPLRNIIDTVGSMDAGHLENRVPRTHTGDELDELGRLFNDMFDRITRLITGMKESLDNVAHDLKTPLTRLINVSEAALRDLSFENDQHQEVHVTVIEETERIKRLLDTIMAVTEAETGVMDLERKVFPVAGVVSSVYDMYFPVAEEKQIQFVLDVPENLSLVADAGRIGQAVANLVDNALKFTPEGGRVRLSAEKTSGSVTIAVSDTGVGVPESEIEKVWDRLYRGDRSRNLKGLGLGLSLVKAIALAHGGSVSITSGPTGGTAVAISVPV